MTSLPETGHWHKSASSGISPLPTEFCHSKWYDLNNVATEKSQVERSLRTFI